MSCFLCTWVAAHAWNPPPLWSAVHECHFFCTLVAAHAWVSLYEQLLMTVFFCTWVAARAWAPLYMSKRSWLFSLHMSSCSFISTPHMSSCSWMNDPIAAHEWMLKSFSRSNPQPLDDAAATWSFQFGRGEVWNVWGKDGKTSLCFPRGMNIIDTFTSGIT